MRLLAALLLASIPLGAQEPGLSLDFLALGRDINGVQEETSLAVVDDTVYTCFVSGSLDVVVAKRSLAGGAWTFSDPIHTKNTDDAHNGCALGVDPEGYIHVAYDMHSSALNYRRSTTPGGRSFTSFPIPVPADAWVTYPRFYRAGNSFYFLYRDGLSGSGDINALEWTVAGWKVLAAPVIRGWSMDPADSPYLGVAAPAPNGDLFLTWTHRVEWWNVGVYFARWDAGCRVWRRADGSTYALPITRATADQVLSPEDPLIEAPSNVGLAVVLDDGVPKVTYAAHRGGHREVLFSTWAGGAWRSTQVTHVQAERLRACPAGPMAVETRPCDMELQGPTAFAFGAGRIALLYGRSVAQSRGAWARPPALLRIAWSEDGGAAWTTREARQDVEQLAGELPRESSGLPYYLHQVAGQPEGDLYLGKVDPAALALPAPRAELSAGRFPLELPDDQAWSGPVTISVWLIPAATGREMTLLDKGGLVGNRELRLLIWGAPNPLHYDPGSVQVGLGDAAGNWGLLWYPPVPGIVPGLLSHLVLTWDGTTAALYLNGTLVASTPWSGLRRDGSAPVLIGGNLNGSGTLDAGRVFGGWLQVAHFTRALTAVEISNLYSAGPPR